MSNIHPIAAAVTGAVVGAGVAVAGVVAMKDENNRKAVKNVMDNVKDRAVGYIEDANKKSESTQRDMQDKLVEGRKKIKQVAGSA